MKNKTRVLSISALIAVLGVSILLAGTAVEAQESMMEGDKMSGDSMSAVRDCIQQDSMMEGDKMSGDSMMTDDASMKMYEVTVTNITPGQPLTPPLLVTHSADASIFTLGEKAGADLQQLAENGNADPVKESLEGTVGVCDIVSGDGPLVPATHTNMDDYDSMVDDSMMADVGMPYTATYEVVADSKHQYLSFVSMLICTNDGFAGLSGVHLPSSGEETFLAVSYDAGTEMNTQDFADMVPPCQALSGVSSDDEGTGASNPDTAEHGIVIPHPGVFPGGDLTSVHAWSDPVAIVTISLVE